MGDSFAVVGRDDGLEVGVPGERATSLLKFDLLLARSVRPLGGLLEADSSREGESVGERSALMFIF